MNVNWTKLAIAIPQLIGVAMSVAEKLKGPKTGREKEIAVLEAIPDAAFGVEGALQIDFVNNPALIELMRQYMAARVALQNGITAAQHLKPAEQPAGTLGLPQP